MGTRGKAKAIDTYRKVSCQALLDRRSVCVDAVLQKGDGDAASHCHRSDRMEPAPHCHETRQATPVASLVCAVVIAKRLGPTDHVTSGMCGLRKGSSRAHEHVTGNPGGRGLVGTHVRQGKATWRYGP